MLLRNLVELPRLGVDVDVLAQDAGAADVRTVANVRVMTRAGAITDLRAGFDDAVGCTPTPEPDICSTVASEIPRLRSPADR